MKPQVVLISVIILLSILVLFQWFNPKVIEADTDKLERRADSLATVNVLLLESAEAAEVERNALRAQINDLDSFILIQTTTITNLNTRRNETNRHIDGLDNDGLIEFFTGFNAQTDTTGR